MSQRCLNSMCQRRTNSGLYCAPCTKVCIFRDAHQYCPMRREPPEGDSDYILVCEKHHKKISVKVGQ